MNVFSYDDALASGRTPRDVRRLVELGEWRALGRGVLCTTAEWDATADDPQARHRLLVAAALRRRPDAVASHGSAAAVYGWPTTSDMRAAVHLTAPPPTRTMRGRFVVHAAAVGPDAWCLVDGIRCTSPARTVLDIARSCDLGPAVAVGDAALRSGRLTVKGLRLARDECRGWPGSRAADRSLELFDARRETPLESWSAVMFHVHGVPAPEPQVTFRDPDGSAWARVDFLWEEQGVVGEADGRVKYDDPRAGSDLWAEKRREDRLRALGLTVVRWGWSDVLDRPTATAARILAALAAAPHGRRL